MNTFDKIFIRIVREQERIIGPVAWNEARKVPGWSAGESEGVSLSGDTKEIINGLVGQYERLFGRASREVCKEAVQDLLAELPSEEIPSSLL